MVSHSKSFAAYWYYKSKGYTVMSGILYGCDFMLYKKGPDFYHSDYGVIVAEEDETENWVQVQASVRSLAKVKKVQEFTFEISFSQ